MSLKKKIQIIDEITKRHPACGVDKGWSYYIGGMGDTGEWYFRKMLNAKTSELRQFLDHLIAAENRPLPEMTEEEKRDASVYHLFKVGEGTAFLSERDRKFLQAIHDRINAKLLFNIPDDPPPK